MQCCYCDLMIPFAAYTAADPMFSMGWTTPKIDPSCGGYRPHLMHNSLGPSESAPHKRNPCDQHTDRQTHSPRYVWHLSQQAASTLCMRCGLKILVIDSGHELNRTETAFILLLMMPQYRRQLHLMMPTTRPVHIRWCSGTATLHSSASYASMAYKCLVTSSSTATDPRNVLH